MSKWARVEIAIPICELAIMHDLRMIRKAEPRTIHSFRNLASEFTV
jgi:hypothetical protein